MRVSGFSNGISFQRSTITFEDDAEAEHEPPAARVGERRRVLGEHAGPRVNGFTTPVPRRMRSVQAAASTSGVKPSGPFVSLVQRSS